MLDFFGEELFRLDDIRAGSVYSFSPEGDQLLVRLDAEGVRGAGPIHMLDMDTQELSAPMAFEVTVARLSPDGSEVIYITLSDLYLFDIDEPEEPPQKIVDDVERRGDLEWAPDGEHITFVDEDVNLCIIKKDGSDRTVIREEVPYFSWLPHPKE